MIIFRKKTNLSVCESVQFVVIWKTVGESLKKAIEEAVAEK